MRENKVKSVFSFDIPAQIIHKNESFYTPPFATSYNMFWQLRLKKNSNDPNCYALTLNAIPNPEEEISSSTWDDREKFSATLFMKNPDLSLDHGPLCASSSKDYEFGVEKFVSINELPKVGYITIGVWFNKIIIEYAKPEYLIPPRPWPKNLVEAWENELNKSDFADIQFNVNNKKIYARSSILSLRSEYFRKMIEGGWTETNQCDYDVKDNKVTATFKDTSKRPDKEGDPQSDIIVVIKENSKYSDEQLQNWTPPQIRYKVNVTDVHEDTFLEMLRYLYTNNLEFDSTSLHKRPLDIFIIADKYLIPDLRQLAKSQIYKDLTVDNAAEILFGQVYEWDDLKKDVMKYVVSEFSKIRKTDGYKKVILNNVEFPAAVELMSELIKLLVPEDDNDKVPEEQEIFFEEEVIVDKNNVNNYLLRK
ncbi:4380_t:CDS:2 [Dentiscutata erythropus]|uniref:4380_t:CDS:1 n=1 Tax=Dentiscutata erythropus TaxID=1348616 RepID=A0A9N9P607_9GLOM|nr:4380_t:CDS:2 [Dentiscutata erythropus]